MFVRQHWDIFLNVTEIFILVPPLLGLKGNLEMTLASRLSTAVRSQMLLKLVLTFSLWWLACESCFAGVHLNIFHTYEK